VLTGIPTAAATFNAQHYLGAAWSSSPKDKGKQADRSELADPGAALRAARRSTDAPWLAPFSARSNSFRLIGASGVGRFSSCPGQILGTSRHCLASPIAGPMGYAARLGHSSHAGASMARPSRTPIRSWPWAGSELEPAETAAAGILDDPALSGPAKPTTP
jgi:hypothetical protein